MVMRGRASAKLPEQVKGQRAGATVGRETVHFSERLWAFAVTLGLVVTLLAAQLFTTMMQIGLFHVFRLRIDAIVFGATIAGPEISLLPWQASSLAKLNGMRDRLRNQQIEEKLLHHHDKSDDESSCCREITANCKLDPARELQHPADAGCCAS